MSLTEADQLTVDAVTDKLFGEHRKWIEDFAHRHGHSYDTIMDAAKAYIDTGEVLDIWDEFDHEFWVHYQRVSGKQVPDGDQGSFFVCCASTGGG